MKKAILFVIFCLVICRGFAQEHLLFFGIPIDGSIESFEHNMLWNEQFERHSDKDENGEWVFSGKILDEYFWIYADYDTKRAINARMVYQVVAVHFFESRTEAEDFLSRYFLHLMDIYGDHVRHSSNDKQQLAIEMGNGIVEAVLKDKGNGRWSIVSRFLDDENDRRRTKTFDYYSTPSKGSDGSYDISPEHLKIHGR